MNKRYPAYGEGSWTRECAYGYTTDSQGVGQKLNVERVNF